MVESREEPGTSHSPVLNPAEQFKTSLGGSRKDSQEGGKRGILSPLRKRLIATDAVVITASIGLGLWLSARASSWAINPILAIYGTPIAIAMLWQLMLFLRGTYDQRLIGSGSEEIRRIVTATLYTFALVAGLSFLLRADISRAYAFVSLPLGLLTISTSRFYWRGWLYRRRGENAFLARTLVVGNGQPVVDLTSRLNAERFAGFLVVDCYPAPRDSEHLESTWIEGLLQKVDDLNIEAVAVSPSETITGDVLRETAWQIEGRSIDLLIAPAMIDVVGPRLSVRPAAGLPLLHLDGASLSRSQRFSKRALDILLGTAALVLLSPVLLLTAIAVKISSHGTVIFRQVRIGRSGESFTLLKFRSMLQDADGMREKLRVENQMDEPMFKLEADPRITRVGRILRRWSIDELPQLLNVLGGSMSLVGPRPHPLDDVNRYEVEAFRRLALKPGMTGLWQVEGRSDLRWSEALQLDLYYVETWSLAGDVVLLARTARAVFQGRGAT